MTRTRSFDLMADFHQFVVHDSNGDWSDLPDRWTEETVEAMFVQGEDYIAVGTARDMKVPVTIRVHPAEPPIERADHDRVAAGKLSVPSGVVVVTGITDNELTGGRLVVDPGLYRVRVQYSGLGSISADGLSGDDRYVVELWPE
jgi:hypothetical protein